MQTQTDIASKPETQAAMVREKANLSATVRGMLDDVGMRLKLDPGRTACCASPSGT